MYFAVVDFTEVLGSRRWSVHRAFLRDVMDEVVRVARGQGVALPKGGAAR
jgi:hypothetical protein